MSITDIIYDAEQAIEDYLANLTEVSGKDLGLDPRALHQGWADNEAIIVSKSSDRSLQYYGGFEYVDTEARTVIGDYVIYTCGNDESGRVESSMECWKETVAEKKRMLP
jgi:hypothetical protein